MPRIITALLALFYCRKELTYLSLMVIAIPIALIFRGCCYYNAYSSEWHQQKAIQLFKQGPDLIAIQLDSQLDAAHEYNRQIKFFQNPLILATQKNYNIVYGRPYYDGTILDIIDVPLQKVGMIPVPNVIERSTSNDKREVQHRLFYVFQGKDALSEANRFLRQYAESEIVGPDDEWLIPDSSSGSVDRPWITRFKSEPSYISARMWWGSSWFLDSNNRNSTTNYSGDYTLSYYNHRDYMAPIINSKIKLRKLN